MCGDVNARLLREILDDIYKLKDEFKKEMDWVKRDISSAHMKHAGLFLSNGKDDDNLTALYKRTAELEKEMCELRAKNKDL